mgnify:CR=1 FL=1
MFPRNACGDFFLRGGKIAKDNMADRHETEQNIKGRNATVGRSMPVHDMADFTAALEDYKVLLGTLQVPPPDIARAVDFAIENVTTTPHPRRVGNGFINLVSSLSKAPGNKHS